MDLDTNMFILESKVKDENGLPVITLEMDEHGKLTDPIAQALLGDNTDTTTTTTTTTDEKKVQEVTDATTPTEKTDTETTTH